jgi:hypothetical protein
MFSINKKAPIYNSINEALFATGTHFEVKHYRTVGQTVFCIDIDRDFDYFFLRIRSCEHPFTKSSVQEAIQLLNSLGLDVVEEFDFDYQSSFYTIYVGFDEDREQRQASPSAACLICRTDERSSRLRSVAF